VRLSIIDLSDAAMTLFPLMAIELWCRALDAAPAVGARLAHPSHRMAAP
jgi:hypothetical protein